jgi:hypothetical protein
VPYFDDLGVTRANGGKRSKHVTSSQEDEHWEKIEESLRNPEWDFRTIDGLAQETGLAPEEIRKLLNMHPTRVRVSNVPDTQGRVLYTHMPRNRSALGNG